VLESIGRGELQTELNRLSKVGQWDEMGRRIDDEVLDAFAVVGEPHEIAAKIAQRYGGLFDRVLGGVAPAIPDETRACASCKRSEMMRARLRLGAPLRSRVCRVRRARAPRASSPRARSWRRSTRATTATLEPGPRDGPDRQARREARAQAARVLAATSARRAVDPVLRVAADVERPASSPTTTRPARDDDQWLFLPALLAHEADRLLGQERQLHGVGLQLCRHDEAAARPTTSYTLMKELEIDGPSRVADRAVPTRAGAGQRPATRSRSRSCARTTSSWCAGVRWVKKGSRLKYFEVKKLEQIDGIWVATEMDMATRKGEETLHRTRLSAKNVALRPEAARRLLHVRQLEKGPERFVKAGLCIAFLLAAALPARAQQTDDLDSVLGGFERGRPQPAPRGGEQRARSGTSRAASRSAAR
jgi:hypothetical protein